MMEITFIRGRLWVADFDFINIGVEIGSISEKCIRRCGGPNVVEAGMLNLKDSSLVHEM